MNLKDYFSQTQGIGVLSTADATGRVDARPHPQEDGTLALIMRDRLTHKNLQENPYAAYLFMEPVPGYRGVRLYLKKLREDDDPELLRQLTRRSLTAEEDRAKGPKFMVYFRVEKVLKLIGGEEL